MLVCTLCTLTFSKHTAFTMLLLLLLLLLLMAHSAKLKQWQTFASVFLQESRLLWCDDGVVVYYCCALFVQSCIL
jgi:hypothetical protein